MASACPSVDCPAGGTLDRARLPAELVWSCEAAAAMKQAARRQRHATPAVRKPRNPSVPLPRASHCCQQSFLDYKLEKGATQFPSRKGIAYHVLAPVLYGPSALLRYNRSMPRLCLSRSVNIKSTVLAATPFSRGKVDHRQVRWRALTFLRYTCKVIYIKETV